jgi:hypothetical protein
MTRPPRSLLPWVLGFSLAAVMSGCLPKHMELQRYNTGRPTLTLEELWETILEYDSGRTVPAEVEASCSPADRCKAVVLRGRRRGSGFEPLLDVIGLGPGLAEVAVRHREYESQTWVTDHITLEFVPTKPLPTLELGMRRPKGSFKFDHLSPQLLAHGIKGPARCDLVDDFNETYACFGVTELLGEKRYHSCADHCRRCDPGHGIEWGRFGLNLNRDLVAAS